MQAEAVGNLERKILVHLLDHRGHQVRFEADQWTTEFGILRSFPEADGMQIRAALRSLEMARWIYQRVQYVIGYTEPKLVYSLTPSGHRWATELVAGNGSRDVVTSATVMVAAELRPERVRPVDDPPDAPPDGA
jgi:DNA-binding PadR family transcriptional regulator